MTRFLLLLPFFILAACAELPEPRHTAFEESGSFRSLHTVPDRPKITVPLGQRIQMERELKEQNDAAREIQRDAGFQPTLPEDKPAIPPEVE